MSPPTSRSLNVFENSHSAMPLIYKFTSVWGNHEGSMLLWVLILALFGALVAAFGGNLPATLKANVLAVQSWIAAAFYLFILLHLEPVPAHSAGAVRGPRPQSDPSGSRARDPSAAALSRLCRLLDLVLVCDRGPDRRPHRCRLGALGAAVDACGLDVPDARHRHGLVLGLLRARLGRLLVLGSGRERLADAVDRRHGAAAFRRGDGEAQRAEGLDHPALDPDLLAVADRHVPGPLGRADFGAHLRQRSDARRVHPAILILFIGGGLALYAWRAPALKQGGLFAPISREGALVFNNLFLTAACATVFIGTLYPLALEALTGEKISVGAPFFNLTFGPLFIPLLLVVPLGPLMPWKRGDLLGVAQRLIGAAAFALVVIAATFAMTGGGPVLAPFGVGLAAFVMAGAVTDLVERSGLMRLPLGTALTRARGLPRSAFGTMIAHFGLGVSLLGIVCASTWGTEQIVAMKAGATVSLRSYDLTFDGMVTRQGSNYRELIAKFTVRQGGEVIGMMEPSKRTFPSRQSSTTEAALLTRGQSARSFAGRSQRRRLDRDPALSQAAGAADLARRGGDVPRRGTVAV